MLLKLPETSGSLETIQPFKQFSNVHKSVCAVSMWMCVCTYCVYKAIVFNNFCGKISFSLISLFGEIVNSIHIKMQSMPIRRQSDIICTPTTIGKY